MPPLSVIRSEQPIIASKSDPAELPKVDFRAITSLKNLRSWLDLGRFLAYLMTLIALKVAADVNLGVKAIMGVKKSAKATTDIKPLKSTLTRSVD